jgi:hypothetical protein
MDRQVTVRHVALAEPDELTFCAAFLASKRGVSFHLEMNVVFALFDFPDIIFAKM